MSHIPFTSEHYFLCSSLFPSLSLSSLSCCLCLIEIFQQTTQCFLIQSLQYTCNLEDILFSLHLLSSTIEVLFSLFKSLMVQGDASGLTPIAFEQYIIRGHFLLFNFSEANVHICLACVCVCVLLNISDQYTSSSHSSTSPSYFH